MNRDITVGVLVLDNIHVRSFGELQTEGAFYVFLGHNKPIPVYPKEKYTETLKVENATLSMEPESESYKSLLRSCSKGIRSPPAINQAAKLYAQ